MLTVFSLVALIAIVVLIIVLISLLVLRKKKMFVITSVLSILLVILVTVINLVGAKPYFNIGILDMKYDNHLEDVSLVSDKTNYLYDNINKTKITFKDSVGNYRPVYLKDGGRYLILVFSTDNKLYEDDLFFQSDYQYYNNVDKLFLINKENGSKVSIRNLSDIGKTFDLSKVRDYNNSAIIPVLMLHSLDISYLNLYVISDHFSDRGYENYLRLTPFEIHYDDGILDNYSYVKDYIYDKHNNLFQIDNLGNVTYSINRISFDGESIQYSTTFGTEIFKDLFYVKEGYYQEYLEEIYFLDNDLRIIKLINKQEIVIKELTTIDDWDLFFK